MSSLTHPSSLISRIKMVGKTLVVELLDCDEKSMYVAMKTVSKVQGIQGINVDSGANKLTVLCGSADPIHVVNKLRKRCSAKIVSIVATIDEKKKKEEEDKKKEDEKKKKEAAEKEAAESKKQSSHTPQMPVIGYYLPPQNYFYSVDDNPNACVII